MIAKSVRRTGAAVFGSLEGARDLSILFWFCSFVVFTYEMHIWGFPKIRGPVLGPLKKDHSILGSPYFGKLPCVCVRVYVYGVGMQVSIRLSIYMYMYVYLTILRLYSLRNGASV